MTAEAEIKTVNAKDTGRLRRAVLSSPSLMSTFGLSFDITTIAERTIRFQFTKSDWFPIAAALSPVPVFALLFALSVTRAATTEFMKENWGSSAGVWGLGVTFITLLVAQRAREAANAAKREARRRNLAEDLQDAHTKSQQVGLFIRDAKWDTVFLRAQEISSACSLVLKRWQDELTGNSRSQITLARDQAGSIARVAMAANRLPPSAQQILNISAAQRRMNELLSSELGESLRVIEGSQQANE